MVVCWRQGWWIVCGLAQVAVSGLCRVIGGAFGRGLGWQVFWVCAGAGFWVGVDMMIAVAVFLWMIKTR